ncbi:MAG: type II toxin-antitoxin system VapC family toxin [Oscillatoria sp. SIO1A7]|nr:type II toxin-antitoxin system VapC family toxin [Oscillatoria sp. SIO1A7]
MTQLILDTDHVSLLQRNEPLVVKRFNEAVREDIAITIITVEEQMRGRLSAIKRAGSSERVISAYAKLQATVAVLKKFPIIDFDEAAYNCYASLRRQKIRIGSQDLRIGAIALSRNAVVVTRNRRDFGRIPGLLLEDWTIA